MSSYRREPDRIPRGLKSGSEVVYLWDPTIADFSYEEGAQHPMKPMRLHLTHELIRSLGILDKVTLFCPPPIPKNELRAFHPSAYIDFLEYASTVPEKRTQASPYAIYFPQIGATQRNQRRIEPKERIGCKRLLHFTDDCPPFEGVYEFSRKIVAGSVAGAVLLSAQRAKYCIHWAGGLHHARRWEASGFCYFNDIVLAILELLNVFSRVLYIDIDIHHGDGVEEAFYTTSRVFTLSFHKGDNFFPGTGKREDRGLDEGSGYALNIPLFDGVDDVQFYHLLFRPIVRRIVETFNPQAIVMQCGADSLSGDRIGTFNLSSFGGHVACVNFVRLLDRPTLFLGGRGVHHGERCTDVGRRNRVHFRDNAHSLRRHPVTLFFFFL